MPAFKTLAPALVLLGLLAARQVAAEPCNTTFFDAISGANSDTGLFEQGLSLAGAKDKLPDPNALPVTILVPNNKAWFDLMFKNGFFLRQISDLGPMLTGLMTYHILPQPLSPDQVKQEGKAQSLYGLLTGQDMPLTHYAKFDDGQLLFMGRPDGEEIAGVVETIQVCNSWVYIVDEVLKPTVDLSDVAQVDLSTISSIGGATSGGSASPQPSPSPSPEATPSPPADGSNGGSTEAPAAAACDKTFAQVAGETPGLSILKTVVSQSQFAGALPDPSGNYTLFAPTDNAFFSLLTTYNLSITDALALGDRLTSVLLYHVAVGALTPDQLAKETSLTTGLALKTQDSQYTIGVSTADGKTSVSGRAPGNTAAIQQNLAVCGSQVYVIDKVLVPSPALDAIPAVSGGLTSTASTPSAPASPAASPSPAPEAEPSPSPAAEAAPSPSPAPAPSPSPAPEPSPSPAPVPSAPSPAAPAPQPAQPAEAGTSTNALSGVALGTGYLQGCEVQLVRDGEMLKSATTDGSGRFSFDCGADCTTLGASLKLPAAGQQAGCADSLTKLPPPFDVLAPVSALPLGVDQPLALSPLTTIIATASRPAVSTSSLPAVPAPEPAPTNRKLLQGGAARAPAPQPVASGANKLNPDFAIAEDSGNASSSMVSTEYGDLLKAAMGGDLMAYKLLSSNQELMCAGSVSGTLLSALAGGEGTTAAQASQALFNQLAKDLLAGSPFNLTDAASVEGLLGRALAELTSGSSASGTPAGVDAKAVQSAAASTLTLVNSLLEQAVATAESSQMKDGADKLVELLARLAKVCQASIAPAASQLGSGQLSVDAWQQQFGLDRIRDLAVAAQL